MFYFVEEKKVRDFPHKRAILSMPLILSYERIYVKMFAL